MSDPAVENLQQSSVSPEVQSKGTPPEGKKPFYKKAWFYVVVVIAIIVIAANSNSGSSENEDDTAESQDQSTFTNSAISTAPEPISTDPEPISTDPEPISVDQEFSSGHYTAGIDFPAGVYDIVAVSGGGNVSSSNLYDGGINAIMGTEDKNTGGLDMYEQEYKNIDLPEGTTLTINGVTVRLTCDDASGTPLTPRNQEITETVELGNGNFVAGEDFPAGVYDIVAVSGGGNVSSSNLYDGGINAIMGTEDKNTGGLDMYEQEYKNIDLPEGTTLTIDGVQVQLVPSA